MNGFVSMISDDDGGSGDAKAFVLLSICVDLNGFVSITFDDDGGSGDANAFMLSISSCTNCTFVIFSALF